MKGIKFICGKHRQLANNKSLIIETAAPHLMGVVTLYSKNRTWEEVYDHLVNNQNLPDWKIGKAKGFRCFVTYYDSMDNYKEKDFDDVQKQYVKQCMEEMAEFELTQISAGMLREYQE